MSKTTLRNLIVSLVVFVTVVGVVSFAFASVLNSSQTLEQQIATVVEQNQQQATLLRMQRLAENSQTERAELASYFLLQEADYITFLSQVESLAPSLGISLETQQLQQVTRDNKNWIETTFSVSGTRQNVQNFIQVLEDIPYVSRITSVSMREGGGSQWVADIIIQVQLLTYDQ